jgi:hypothetical protein
MPQKTCADSASLDAMESASWHRKPSKSKKIRNSVSTSPGTDQFTRLGNRLVLCTAGFASVRSTISRYGVDARACKRLHPLRNLSLRTGVTEQSEVGKSVGAHPLHRLVWQYMSSISHVYTYTFSRITSFQLWCSLSTTRTRTTSRIRALEPDFVLSR